MTRTKNGEYRSTPGHVRLILYEAQNFYLEIPVNIINDLCLRPLKYLSYLGWCVLGVKGTLGDTHQDEIDLDGDIVERTSTDCVRARKVFPLPFIINLTLTTP